MDGRRWGIAGVVLTALGVAIALAAWLWPRPPPPPRPEQAVATKQLPATPTTSTTTTSTTTTTLPRGTTSTTSPNKPPNAVRDDYPTQHVGTAYKQSGGPWSIDLPVFRNDYDEDGDKIFYLDSTGGTHGTVQHVTCSFDPNEFCLRYTFTHVGPFVDSFTYRIRDGRGGTAIGQVTISVP